MITRITRTRIASAALAAIAFLLFSAPFMASAQVQNPTAPREVVAKWVKTDAGVWTVQLKWAASTANAPVKYAIYGYKGTAAAGTTVDWTLLTTTDGLTKTFSLSDLKLDGGTTYSFRVRAYTVKDNGDTLWSESTIAVATWTTSGDNPLHFTTTPVTTGKINTGYVYEAKATAGDNIAVSYSIKSGPDGMTIDSSTGRITWTPTKAGTYHVVITATDANGHTINQEWNIVVTGGDEKAGGVVEGKVTDAASAGEINGATVTFITVTPAGTLGDAFVVKTGDAGTYRIVLRAGTYRVKATADGYNSEYWDGVSNGDSAKLLVVVDSGSYTVNISLNAVVRGTLGGQVTSATGKAIAGAHVTAIFKGLNSSTGKDAGYGTQYTTTTTDGGNYDLTVPEGSYIVHAEAKGYNSAWADSSHEVAGARVVVVASNGRATANIVLSAAPVNDGCTISGLVTGANQRLAGAKVTISSIDASGTDNSQSYTVTVITNGEGRYTATVPCGASYIAYAAATGFVSEYNENKQSALDADPIKVAGLTTVNFDLTPADNNGASVSGTVYACDSVLTALGAKVTAYIVNAAGNELRAVATVYSDSTGAYTIPYLAAGNYLIQAFPREKLFAPGYYTTDKSCQNDWHNASTLTVAASQSVAGTDVYCKHVSGRHGFLNVNGRVRIIAGGPNNTYLSGGVVYAVDATNNITAYAQTDSTGSFLLDGVDVGNYTLTVDRVQYQTVSQATVITDYDQNASPAPTEITASKQSVSAVSDPTGVVPSTMQLAQNYPNPFNPTTQITFAVPTSGHVALSVYTLAGQTVSTLVNTMMQAGTYHVTFDGSNLPSGTYMYRLVTPQGVVARRMVELK